MSQGSATFAAGTLRQRLNFNREWRFTLGDPAGAEAPSYDDSRWEPVGLPHSFSIPYFLAPEFYVGYGWYRKHFAIPSSDSSKRIFVEFEGVFQVAEVFVNGARVGSHQGGYTGFSIDVTKAVHAGSDNVIAVRVNNLWNPRIAPRAGEHVFSGGIYRDVRLVITSPLHVTWYGTFVRTPHVSKQSVSICIDTEVANDSITPKQFSVETAIIDPHGRTVAIERSAAAIVDVGRAETITQNSPEIHEPQLWSPETPALYTARTTLYEGPHAVDHYETPFGIRWIEWTADRGFFLNGERVYLRGANVHQDHAGWADAVTNAGIERDVRLVKDAGFNFIRGSHYPHDPTFADSCDRLGVLFWSENAFWGTAPGPSPEGYWNASAYPTVESDRADFEANVEQQLTEMIRIFRNHPSIVAWSLCNEVFFTASGTLEPARGLLRRCVSLVHTLDPTRPAGIGGAQRPLDGQRRIDLIGDIAGYNGDGASIGIFQDPGIPNVVTEYGSVVANRPGPYGPNWGDLEKDHGEAVHTWRSGQAIWCMFDHGSIFGHFGSMGLVDYFRIPKRAWYWYRNAYRHVPPPAWPEPGTPARLRLEADRTSVVRTDGTDDVMLTVTVLDAAGKPISNTPPVELHLASGPGEFPTGSSIMFDTNTDIPIFDGQTGIEFRSYWAGKTVIRATSPGLEPTELAIRFVGPASYQEGVTPPSTPHPYVRFTRKNQPTIPQRFGRNNPIFASSAAPGHAAGLAADGDSRSWWEPAPDDTAPAVTVDMERVALVSRIRLVFPQRANYRLHAEISDDRTHWRPISDNGATPLSATEVMLTVPNGMVGRFVRINFMPSAVGGPPSRLSEIEITGTLNPD